MRHLGFQMFDHMAWTFMVYNLCLCIYTHGDLLIVLQSLLLYLSEITGLCFQQICQMIFFFQAQCSMLDIVYATLELAFLHETYVGVYQCIKVKKMLRVWI